MTINGLGAISAANIQDMDLETAMLTVQANRVSLLEAQLKEQITSIQAKNDQVAKLNALLSYINSLAAKFEPGAGPTDTLDGKIPVHEFIDLKNHLDAAGVTLEDIFGKDTELEKIPKSSFDGAVARLKGSIDSLSNTQQMDMLRLQGLSNKRNEAVDVQTNFMKKMQDNRSSIIGNMR